MQDDSGTQADTEALTEAYNESSGVVRHGQTLIIAGTKDAIDVWDDLKIPLNQVHRSTRYAAAVQALRKASDDGVTVTHIVGHSLGGAVAFRLLKDAEAGRLGARFRTFQVRTYGAPFLNSRQHPNVQAMRRAWDPVSMFDRGAQTTRAPGWNPHSHAGFTRSTLGAGQVIAEAYDPETSL